MLGYNSERYVAEALESVRAQTHTDWEVIFVDNGSQDGTEAIVRAYCERDARVRYLRTPRRLTLAECRNLAAREARGEWLAFLDADDAWLPNKLEWQLARVREDGGGDVGLVYARTLSFSSRGEEGETVFRYAGRDLPEGWLLRTLLNEGCIIPLVSALVLKQAYWEVAGIPTEYTFAEDYYLFVAVAERRRVLCVQKACCRYRVHPDSMTAREKTTSHRETLQVLAKWSTHLSPREYRRRVAVYETLIGVDAIVTHRRYWEGLRHIARQGSIPFFVRGVLSNAYRRLVLRRQPIS
jgi:hypothetical protein